MTRTVGLSRLGNGHRLAQIRAGQKSAIRHLVEHRGRRLVSQKTGWGKSLGYFNKAKLLREQRAGPNLLGSPLLLALTCNPLAAAQRMGLEAFTINPYNRKEWDEVDERVAHYLVDFLLFSSELWANEQFQKQVLARISPLLVVDEARCLSEWRRDFRPHYLQIVGVLQGLSADPRLLATTATANKRIQADPQEILGIDLTIQRGYSSRPSLVLKTILLRYQKQRLARVIDNLPQLPGMPPSLNTVIGPRY